MHPYGEPAKGRAKVEAYVEKINRYLEGQACRAGYVIVFEDCKADFSPTFVEAAEATHARRSSDSDRPRGCHWGAVIAIEAGWAELAFDLE